MTGMRPGCALRLAAAKSSADRKKRQHRMRLRFRGACWDTTLLEPFPTAPSTDVPRANTKPPDPLGFFAEFLGNSSFSVLRGSTLLSRNSSTAVPPQPPLIQWRWDIQHGVRLRCKSSTEVHEKLERPSDIKEDTEEESEDTNRPDYSPTGTCDILASSPFCAVVSDPATVPLREPTFSEIMLSDGHGRERLFSFTQDMLLKPLTDVCLREDSLPANSPSHGPPLRYLLESVRKASRELRVDPGQMDGDTEGCQSPASSVTGVPLEVGMQCFGPAATFDLQEEVSFHLLERIPEDDPVLHADIVDLPTGLNAESSKRVVEESWRAIGVEHLLRPLQVPSMSFDVAKFSPSWVTKGSPYYIGRAGGSGRGGQVPMGTKTGAHTAVGVLLPVDKQENLTSAFHPMAASGSTFIRIDVEESARDPDLRLQASLERSSLLDAVESLNHQVQVGTLSEKLRAQMSSDLPVIDRHRTSLRGKHPTIPLASPRKMRGFQKGCLKEKPQSIHARGQPSLEIDYDHCRVDEEYARSPMLWEALNLVKWSTKEKKATETPEGYITPWRRYCLKSGALEVSRVPLGRQLGEDPKSMTDRLLNKILVSWRKMHTLAITEREQPSKVQGQVPTTRKRSASPHPELPQHQQKLQPLLPSSRASDGHSIRRAAPSPVSNPSNLCQSTGENVTPESDVAPAKESTKGERPSPLVVKQVDTSHSKIAPSAARRKEGAVSEGDPVCGSDADKEVLMVKHRSTGMTKLLQSAHQKQGGVETIAGVGDTAKHLNKNKAAGVTSSIDAIKNVLPSDVCQDTDKKSKMPCNAEGTNTSINLTKGLGEAPGKRRCLEGVASKRTTPVQRPLLEASDTPASDDPHSHEKDQSPQMSQQPKPSPSDLPPSSSPISSLAGDKASSDVLPPERQPMHLPQNDAIRCGGKTPSPTQTTVTTSASYKPTDLTPSPAQGVLTESIDGPVAPENPALPCRESSSKKQLPKRERTSTKIAGEDMCPTPQPGSSPTDGDLGFNVCESERHREILSMIRAGKVEEAFRFCGGKAASGSLTRCGPTSAVPNSTTSRRPLASRHEHAPNFDADGNDGKGNPLCAIVSGYFVEVAGPTLLALSCDRTDAEASQRIRKSHHTLTRRVADQSTVKSRRTRAFSFLELPVDAPVDLIIGSRTGVVIIDNRNPEDSASVRPNTPSLARDKGGVPPGDPSAREAPMVVEAKEKFRLLTLQTLKYSSVWLIVQMDKVRADSQAQSPKVRPCSVIDRLEQWLVGFPCRVLIRYSHSEVHLAELITHAALAERLREVPAIGGAGSASVVVREKRRRLETSPVIARSPLDVVDEHSRNDPEWAAVHHRQSSFLQLFPSLNAFSASVLLSAASLKHLLVSPYEELAPVILKREGGTGARGGVDAESLRDFCATIRFEGRGKMAPG